MPKIVQMGEGKTETLKLKIPSGDQMMIFNEKEVVGFWDKLIFIRECVYVHHSATSSPNHIPPV